MRVENFLAVEKFLKLKLLKKYDRLGKVITFASENNQTIYLSVAFANLAIMYFTKLGQTEYQNCISTHLCYCFG